MATGQGRDGRPPIEEIAQALGISKTTVSRALSGKGRVSEETRAKVFAYVGRPGVDSSTPVRRQDPGATHNLSLVIPKHFMQLDLPFLRKCMGGVCTMAAQRGYDLLLCYVSDTDTVQLERQLASHKVDGVILSRTMNPALTCCSSTVCPLLPSAASKMTIYRRLITTSWAPPAR